MRRPTVALVPLFLWLTMLATANVDAQISDSPGSVNCPALVNLTVTVTTEAGAVIPNAVVILREDTLGEPRGVKVFGGELRTEKNGKASAAVRCNYLDIFVAANGFAPSAQKFLITRDAHTFSVPLKMYPITRTTEVPVAPLPPSEMAPLPSTKPESTQSSAQGDPVFYIAKPTIFAFLNPVSQPPQKRDAPDPNDAVTAFHFYGQLALQPLARIGVDYQEVRASGFVVKTGDATTSFRSTQAIGYYFVAPAHVLYGVMSDDDLMEAAQKYFGVGQKQH
ncbi:MAG: hypothetical protein ACHP8B_15460 [Terriglobales bacterium]